MNKEEAKKNLLEPSAGCGYQASEDFFLNLRYIVFTPVTS